MNDEELKKQMDQYHEFYIKFKRMLSDFIKSNNISDELFFSIYNAYLVEILVILGVPLEEDYINKLKKSELSFKKMQKECEEIDNL